MPRSVPRTLSATFSRALPGTLPGVFCGTFRGVLLATFCGTGAAPGGASSPPGGVFAGSSGATAFSTGFVATTAGTATASARVAWAGVVPGTCLACRRSVLRRRRSGSLLSPTATTSAAPSTSSPFTAATVTSSGVGSIASRLPVALRRSAGRVRRTPGRGRRCGVVTRGGAVRWCRSGAYLRRLLPYLRRPSSAPGTSPGGALRCAGRG